MFRFNKKSGFTLSEVLITIGVIGAVAALTIPTLLYNYRGKLLEQQFRSTYSDIKSVVSFLNDVHGDWPAYVNGEGYHKWYGEFMSRMNGGSLYKNTSHDTVNKELRILYGQSSGSGRYRFSLKNGQKTASEQCDDGGIWIDSKGRIWTFNAQHGMFCVDINGTAKPNRQNVDIFAFVPMSPAVLAKFVYDDPDNVSDYSTSVVPCNLEMISFMGVSNSVEASDEDNFYNYCGFFEPIENIAVQKSKYCSSEDSGCGKSARGKTMTVSNNYWNDYVDYR